MAASVYLPFWADTYIGSISVFTILGFISFLIALLADLMNFNRQLIEQTLEKVRRIELEMLQDKDADN